MIYDILSLIIIVVFAIIGIKNGAAKVICRLLAVISAFLLSVFLSHFLAELVYNIFIKQTIVDNITGIINNSSLSTASEKANELLSSLPMALSNSLSYFGVTEGTLSEMFDTTAVSNIESLIKTPIVGIISIILFIVLFVLLLFLLKKVFRGISKIFRLPLIRVIDSILGFALGVTEGVLVVCLLAFLVKLIIPLTGGDVYLLNETAVADSRLFSFIYFGGLSSLVQGLIYSFSNI